MKIRAGFLSVLAGALLSTSTSAGARGDQTGLLSRSVQVGSTSYAYQLYVPSNLARGAKAPVILFLHGIGQRGQGGYIPADGARSALIRSYLDRVPAIILLPQCTKERFWSDRDMDQMVMAALDQTTKEFSVDDRRLYLIGVSMGGYGAWHFAARHAGKFAAAVPICGGSPLLNVTNRFTEIAREVGRTPIWVFHGADDRIVPVSESRKMVEALRKAGGNVQYSEYPGVGHNVWMKALTEPRLLPWLFAQHLGAT